jgi:hypothetical protein
MALQAQIPREPAAGRFIGDTPAVVLKVGARERQVPQ